MDLWFERDRRVRRKQRRLLIRERTLDVDGTQTRGIKRGSVDWEEIAGGIIWGWKWINS